MLDPVNALVFFPPGHLSLGVMNDLHFKLLEHLLFGKFSLEISREKAILEPEFFHAFP